MASRIVSSLTETIAGAGMRGGLAPSAELQWDIDYDGRPDIVRIHMRPHSMRHDVDFILAKDAPFNVVTAHPPPGRWSNVSCARWSAIGI